jgi:hypothetical protein
VFQLNTEYCSSTNLHLDLLKCTLSGPGCVFSHHVRSGAKTEEQLPSTTLRSRTDTMLHINSSRPFKNSSTSKARSSKAKSSFKRGIGESPFCRRERLLPRAEAGARAEDMPVCLYLGACIWVL